MSQSLTGIPVLDVIIAILSGSLGVGILTFLTNTWIKKREEEVEMSKIKMDSVVSNLPTYGLLAALYESLHHELVKRKDNQNQDMRLLFYYICDILRLDRIIYYKNGGLVLNDLDAESIISVFGYVLYSLLSKKFDKEGLSKMRKLKSDSEFHEFCGKITNGENKELYEKFIEWYTTLKEDELTNLEDKSKWIKELLFFELNTIFSRWYQRKPHFSELSDELRKYLYETYKQDAILIDDTKTKQNIKRYCEKIT